MIRKLISTVGVAAVLGSTPLVAQSRFGIVAGVTSSKVTISGSGASVSFDPRTGFAAGLSMAHPKGRDLEFVPELLYVQKGTKLASDEGAVGLKISYVQLPLLFRAKFGSSSVRPYVTAGPAVGVKASCKLSLSSGGTSISDDCDAADLGGTGFKSVDFGVIVGAGIAAKRLSLSVRYDLGLANILDGGDGSVTYKNRSWLALVGYAL